MLALDLKYMNQPYQISVGEPWNFEGPDGPNILFAVSEGVVDGPGKINWADKLLLLRSTKAFQIDNEMVSQLVACPRYEGDTLEKLMTRGCEAGIARVRQGFTLKPGDRIREDQVKYCIIGTVKPIE